MFGIGMPEMLVILAVALVVIGPSRLPEIARSVGRAYAEFSRSMRDVRRGFEDMTSEFDEERDMLNNPKDALGKAVQGAFAEPGGDIEKPDAAKPDKGD